MERFAADDTSPRAGPWRVAARAALWSGSVGSVATTAALAAGGGVERGDPVSPTNGPSQWIWGRRGARARGASLRHTLVGYAIHHATAIMWATVFERMRRPRPDLATTVAAAAATSALAYVVDYKVVPQRLQPGFDVHVSRPTLGLFYVTFAAALALAAWTRRPQ